MEFWMAMPTTGPENEVALCGIEKSKVKAKSQGRLERRGLRWGAGLYSCRVRAELAPRTQPGTLRHQLGAVVGQTAQ